MASETGMSLGEFLRQEREKRGITIEQVASATKVGVKTLHALEADQYAELPAKPFVRGFVTSYSRFVGLDPKEILTRFGSFIDTKAHDRPNRDAGHSGYAFEKREGDQSRTFLWIVMGFFIVAGAVAVIFIKKPGGHRQHGVNADRLKAAYSEMPSPVPCPTPSASPSLLPVAGVGAAPSPVPVAVIAPAPTPVVTSTPVVAVTPLVLVPTPTSTPTTAPTAAAASEEAPDPLNSGIHLKPSMIKHRVVFKASEGAWVRYQCDSRPVTQFVIRTGKVLVLRAMDFIKFQVSPPKAIHYSYRGSGFKPLVGDQHLVTRQNDATLFFPFELSNTIEKPFSDEKPLSNRAVPAPRPASPLSPVTQ